MTPLTILIFGLAFITVFGKEECRQGLPRNAFQKSLDGKCYVVFTSEDKDYPHAAKRCKELNGLLAMPKTKRINDFLAGTLKNVTKARAWIGLDDVLTENAFQWADGKALFYDKTRGFHPFGKAEGPHKEFSIKGYLEDCIALDSSGSWHDYFCRSYRVQFLTLLNEDKDFICEFIMSTVTATPPVITTGCPPFDCTLNCGLGGFTIDTNGCFKCECDNN